MIDDASIRDTFTSESSYLTTQSQDTFILDNIHFFKTNISSIFNSRSPFS
jgi:hypothetical protein